MSGGSFCNRLAAEVDQCAVWLVSVLKYPSKENEFSENEEVLLTGAAFDPRQRGGDQAWRHLAEERRVLAEGQKVARDGWILVIRVGTKLLCYSVITLVHRRWTQH